MAVWTGSLSIASAGLLLRNFQTTRDQHEVVGWLALCDPPALSDDEKEGFNSGLAASIHRREKLVLWIFVLQAIAIGFILFISLNATPPEKSGPNKASILTTDPQRVKRLMIIQPSTYKLESILLQI